MPAVATLACDVAKVPPTYLPEDEIKRRISKVEKEEVEGSSMPMLLAEEGMK